MERHEYEKLAAVEDRMWWFRGTHGNLLAAVSGRTLPEHRPVLDAGCGTGGFLKRLARTVPGRSAVGLELDRGACAMARERTGCAVVNGSVHSMPFSDGEFAAIFSADVLCHGGVEEARTLSEFRRCLAVGGALVLNLPAYPWLLSEHDRAVDNVRRYTAAEVARMLADAGFGAIRTSYWNTILFPLMVARRKLSKAVGSDVALSPAPVEALFGAIVRLETFFIGRGLRLPFGGSVLAVAEKHA